MFKRALKIFLYTVLSLVILVVLGIGSIYVFKKPITNKVTQSISAQLATRVNISAIDLSIFKNFPYVNISFHKINAAESSKITGMPLMKMEKFTVTINPINLLMGRYTLENITLENGELRAAIEDGKNNFTILKTGNSKTSGGKFNVEVKKVTLENIKVLFFDNDKGDTLALVVKKVEVSGKFSEKEFLVTTGGSLIPLSIKMAGQPVALTRALNFKTSFTVNKPDSLIRFSKTKFNIEDFNFVINGKISTARKNPNCDVQIIGDNLNLKQLLQLIPKDILKETEAYESNGMLECRVDIKGPMGNGNTPNINASFKMLDGMLGKKGLDVQMRNIQLAGELKYETNGPITTSVLDLKQVSATVNGERVYGRAKISSFKDPYLEAKVEGDFNLKQWMRLFKNDVIDTASGHANISLAMEGKISGFKKDNDILPALFEGTVIARDVNLTIKGSPQTYKSINGKVYANNNLLSIDTLHGSINGNTIGLKGKAENLLDFLFSGNKNLHMGGELYSPHLDIPSIAGVSDESGSVDTTGPGLVLPKNIRFRLKSRLDKLTFDKLDARNFRGAIEIDEGVVTANSISFEAMGGSFAITANLYDKGNQDFVISAEMNVQNVDIQQLFYQSANFGQKEITSDNLQGILTGHLQLAAPMDKYMRIDNRKLYARGKLAINGGRLYNYEPLTKLSSFIDVNELRDIAFDKLENTFEIKDMRINMPKMEIKNSALFLELGGFHGFDNYMEYTLRLKLKEVLSKKFNLKKAKTENYDEDKEGINLYLLMKGTPDNLKIRYDAKSAFNKLKQNIKEEKNTFMDLLRDEFNIQKKDKDGKELPSNKKKDPDKPLWENDIPQ